MLVVKWLTISCVDFMQVDRNINKTVTYSCVKLIVHQRQTHTKENVMNK